MIKTIYTFSVIVVFLIMSGALVNRLLAQPQNEITTKNEQKSKNQLLPYKIDETPDEVSLSPLLHPKRFERRIKMLWGIDINDYPENAIIQIGGFEDFSIYLYKQDFICEINYYEGESSPYDEITHFGEIAEEYCKWTLMNDKESFEKLKAHQEKYKNVVNENEEDEFGVFNNDNFIYYQPLIISFNLNEDLLHFISNYSNFDLDYRNRYVFSKISDMKSDTYLIQISNDVKKEKKIKQGYPVKNEPAIYLGSDFEDYLNTHLFLSHITGGDNPWNTTIIQIRATKMNYLLRLNELFMHNKKTRNYLITYLAGKDSTYIDGRNMTLIRPSYGMFVGFKDTIIANNYYGYTLLREFMTNPKREMPTLEKIGTSFRGKVKTTTKLLLEPFSESMDYDTINIDEAFAAYEMGYDDYYFIEMKKPVESPVAGPDGYAMIIDQTETVRGYLKKEDIEEIKGNSYATPDLLVIAKYKDAKTVKTGVINDPDGYVNIRAAGRMDAGIISKLEDNKEFKYWEITENTDWCIVETEKGVRGFVYKNRVVENKSKWIVDK